MLFLLSKMLTLMLSSLSTTIFTGVSSMNM